MKSAPAAFGLCWNVVHAPGGKEHCYGLCVSDAEAATLGCSALDGMSDNLEDSANRHGLLLANCVTVMSSSLQKTS